MLVATGSVFENDNRLIGEDVELRQEERALVQCSRSTLVETPSETGGFLFRGCMDVLEW